MNNEFEKLVVFLTITSESISLEPSSFIKTNVTIKTYQDHRMAMAFAPLALKTNLMIEEAEVVSKSYPVFWDDLQKIGFVLKETL